MKKTLVGLNLAVFIVMLGLGMVASSLPERAVALTGSTTSAGYLATVFALPYLLLQLPLGKLADRFGFKQFLIAGYLICAVCSIIYGFAKSAPLFWVGRMLHGVAEAPLWALAPALLSILYPQDKGRVMGLYNGIFHTGCMFGPLLGIVVLTYAGRFADVVPFFFLFLVSLIGAGVIQLTVTNPVRDVGRERGKQRGIQFGNIAGLLADRKLLSIFTGITVYGIGYGMFVTCIPAYFRAVLQYDRIFVQFYFFCFYLAISLALVVTGYLTDRLGRTTFIFAGLSLLALLVFVFPILGKNGAVVALFLATFGLGSFSIASMAFLNDAVPDSQKGTVSGAYYLFWGVGYCIGPALISNINRLPGNVWGFYFFTCLVVVELVVLAKVFRKKATP